MNSSDCGPARRERILRSFGCTPEQWQVLRGDVSLPYEFCPIRKWVSQKRDAGMRGIEWHLTLWEWWQVWQVSGHWGQRGKGADNYCMCRHGDVGPYSTKNVYIATNSTNISDAWKSGKKRLSNSFRNGLGVEFLPRSRSNPFRAKYKGKSLGCFPTFDKARTAYLEAKEIDFLAQ